MAWPKAILALHLCRDLYFVSHLNAFSAIHSYILNYICMYVCIYNEFSGNVCRLFPQPNASSLHCIRFALIKSPPHCHLCAAWPILEWNWTLYIHSPIYISFRSYSSGSLISVPVDWSINRLISFVVFPRLSPMSTWKFHYRRRHCQHCLPIAGSYHQPPPSSAAEYWICLWLQIEISS